MTKEHRHGGRIADYLEQIPLEVQQIVDFSANIHPFGPPEKVRRAVLAAISEMGHYPDAKHRVLRKHLAQREGVTPQSVVVGNGASEILEWCVRGFAATRLVLLDPAFSEYRAVANRLGIPVLAALLIQTEDTFRLPAVGSIDFRRGDVLVLNNPHNPTSTFFSTAECLPFLEDAMSRGAAVMFDEAFHDFLLHDEESLGRKLFLEGRAVAVVRSATKYYAIPGLRLGYALMPVDLAERVYAERDGWTVNAMALAAGVAAYGPEDIELSEYSAQTLAWLREERAFIRETWGRTDGVRLFRMAANYFFVEMERGDEWSLQCQQELSRLGMFVRDCFDFPGCTHHHWRVAIRTREENERLFERVERALQQTNEGVGR